MAVTLDRIPTMIQGEGALGEIGTLAVALGGAGARVLLAADPGLKPTGMVDEALAVLRGAGAAPILFDDIKSDPSTKQADAGAALARAEAASVVVALGGGSALDIGKVIAAIAPAAASAEAYALCATAFPAGSEAGMKTQASFVVYKDKAGVQSLLCQGHPSHSASFIKAQ